MESIDLNNMSAVEILSLARKGNELKCPRCQAILETIPKKWTGEVPLHGVVCPNNQKHFLIYSEPEHASKNVRNLIKEMVKKSEER